MDPSETVLMHSCPTALSRYLYKDSTPAMPKSYQVYHKVLWWEHYCACCLSTTRSLSWTQLLAAICKWLPYLPGSPQHRRPAGIATRHWCPWEEDHTLGVYFNPTKWSVKTIFRSTLITKMYLLHNTIPAKVDSIVYLGIAISSELSWSAQIPACTKETNATLGFIRQNLSTAAEKGILHLPGEFSYGLQHHRLGPPTQSRM